MPRFNAGDIFSIAVDTEQKAAAYYRRAAGLASDRAGEDFFLELARIEEEHGRLFAALGAEEAGADSGREGFSADEWRLYLEALDRLHAGGEGAAGELLTGRETLEEVVRQAIRAEAHAILFYIGVKSLARSTADQEAIELIILEEKRHIVELQNFRHARAALPRRGGRPGASP